MASDFSDGINAFKQGNGAKAAELFQKACDNNYSPGCINLGVIYSNGYGVKQDKAMAAKLYTKACELDATKGCYLLGNFYLKGDAIGQNLKKSDRTISKIMRQ